MKGFVLKSFKLPLITLAAAVVLFVMLGCAKDTEKRYLQRDVVVRTSAIVSTHTLPDYAVSDTVAAVSDTIMPPAKLPVLKIDGKEDPNVYLQSLDIQVEVTGNIASTRYTMVFKNKTNRILEGELTFPLPDGRTVTHYALDINGKMREAVPVEKARATQVFEEIQQREVDPGILERVEGNNFRTRIYPFPRQGTRTISIGYEEELSLENNLLYYRLPMAYPDSLEKFAVKATVWQGKKPIVSESENEIRFDKADENYVASFARENYQPSRALIFALPAPANIPQVMMQAAQGSYYFLASVVPQVEARKKQWSDELAIIWDVSLSGSQRDIQREIQMLDIIFAEKKNANIHLYFLNNRLKKVTEGKWLELKKVLETAVFDGGTDFSQINLNDIVGNEILFFSDGISTLSDVGFFKNAKVNRPIHCIVSSSKADYSTMRLIAGKTKGKFINLNALSSENLKNELLNETLMFLGAEHENALREVYPSIAAPVYGNFSIAGISDKDVAELTLLFGFGDKVEKKINVKLNAKDAASQGNTYRIWAQKKIAELDLEYEKNRAELTELGQQFGVVTRNTSLIVLELISDYIRYGIEPPDTEPELQAEYRRRQKGRGEQQRDVGQNMLKEAVAAAEGFKKWWGTDFTPKKAKYPTPDKPGTRIDSRQGTSERVLREPENVDAADVVGWMDNPSAVFVLDSEPIGGFNEGYAEGGAGGIGNMLGGLMGGSAGGISMEARGSSSEKKEASQPTIAIKLIKKDNDYLSKLTGKTAEDYQIYLKLRNDYASLPTFYFDMADWFYKLGDKETALRILTSIADLELENASLYRLLGYKFKEYGEYVLQKFVTQKLIEWRPMEPQSYRDYALALADNGETQAALDSLYSLLTKNFSQNIIRRSQGIEEVVVTEINQLISKNSNLNSSQIDKRLLINIPVDIRVVINWNMNNTDIDLHVKDPSGEECYYGYPQTSAGGRISADNTGGYGPEQFMLKRATKGKYQVYVNYFRAREFAADGPATIMAEIFIKYADKTEERQVVTFQLSNAKSKEDRKVQVAEFEF
ncbi:MAG: DUF2135 domain-containing protein [Fibromonadaceae bacterium]|jgi:hypothetical protein|nr:DUF2135 domain-containing protein [Fibromonadaceae bacterium]